VIEQQPMTQQPINALKLASAILALFTVLVTVLFFSWWSMKERFIFGHDAYDPVRWMAPVTEQSPPCDRGDMVLDLQHRLLKPGMSKSDATMLLGRPAWEEPGQIEYELGVCLWAVHGLRLYFDRDGRLIHTAIVKH
jgi:hypothetical protein